MAFRDEIEKLELSDEAKTLLLAEHEKETAPDRQEAERLRKEAREAKVNEEITLLSDGILKGQPGVLKYVRRVFLSDDGKPGTVLLSDNALGLSGDDATGARADEDKSTADVLREFIELATEHKIQFADQALVEHAQDAPGSGEEPTDAEKADAARERLGAITGHTEKRTRSRYTRTTGGVI